MCNLPPFLPQFLKKDIKVIACVLINPKETTLHFSVRASSMGLLYFIYFCIPRTQYNFCQVTGVQLI
jgi:hypothetical protein